MAQGAALLAVCLFSCRGLAAVGNDARVVDHVVLFQHSINGTHSRDTLTEARSEPALKPMQHVLLGWLSSAFPFQPADVSEAGLKDFARQLLKSMRNPDIVNAAFKGLQDLMATTEMFNDATDKRIMKLASTAGPAEQALSELRIFFSREREALHAVSTGVKNSFRQFLNGTNLLDEGGGTIFDLIEGFLEDYHSEILDVSLGDACHALKTMVMNMTAADKELSTEIMPGIRNVASMLPALRPEIEEMVPGVANITMELLGKTMNLVATTVSHVDKSLQSEVEAVRQVSKATRLCEQSSSTRSAPGILLSLALAEAVRRLLNMLHS